MQVGSLNLCLPSPLFGRTEPLLLEQMFYIMKHGSCVPWNKAV